MNAEKLRQLIQQPEGLKLDIKQKLHEINHSAPKAQDMAWGELIKDVLALANGNVGTAGQPGYLIIGAADKLKADGTRDLFDVGNVELTPSRLLKKINEFANPPLPDIHFDTIELDGCNILVTTIPPSPYLHEIVVRGKKFITKNGKEYSDRTAFIRTGEEIRAASTVERQAILKERVNQSDQRTSWTIPPKHTHLISKPYHIEREILELAQHKLASLVVNEIPAYAALPPGSRMPFSRNSFFVGRAIDLIMLARVLQASDTGANCPTAAITGLGGIGKTQLVSEFVHRYGQYFLGGVFWLNFADPDRISSEISACGGWGGLELRPDFNDLPLDDQVQLVISAWQSPLPRLLVFDGCEDESLFTQWWPVTGGCRILITSRRSDWDSILGIHRFGLDVLNRIQSIELLHKYLPDQIADDADMSTIAEELGDLPLALHLAGSYLARYRHVLSPVEYINQLRAVALLDHPSLKGKGTSLSPTNHELNVGKTFALSFDRLDKTIPIDEMAVALLMRAAHLTPGEPIDRSILTLTLGPIEDPLQAEDALVRLVELGLLSEEYDGDLLLHSLLAVFVLDAGKVNRVQAQKDVEKAFLSAASYLNTKARHPSWLLSWQSHLRTVVHSAYDRRDEMTIGLCNALADHLKMIGDYAGAELYYERAFTVIKEIFGEQHPNTASASNNLGYLFYLQANYAKAQEYLEQALAIFEAEFGDTHPHMASNLNNLGLLAQTQGDLPKAREDMERALAIYNKVQPEDSPDIANILNNLGRLLHAQGELTEAQGYLEDALAMWERIYGEDHPDVANTLNNLGVLLHDNEDLVGAQKHHERALTIWEEVLGVEHPDTATSLSNLGATLRAQGNLDLARDCVERAIVIQEKVLGQEHPDLVGSLSNMGLILHAQGDLVGAQVNLERALVIQEKVFGEYHTKTAIALDNLGTILQAQGNFAKAKEYHDRALAIREKIGSSEDPDTIIVLRTLADQCSLQGDFQEAERYFRKLLTIQEKLLGKGHFEVADSMNAIGYCLYEQNHLDKAYQYYERALAIYRKIYGDKHPDTAIVLNNIGSLLQEKGDLLSARKYFEKALDIQTKALGMDHVHTATSLNNLGSLLSELQELEGAERHYEQALKILESHYPPEHPHIFSARENLDRIRSVRKTQSQVGTSDSIRSFQRLPTKRQEPYETKTSIRPGRNDPCWCGSGKKYKHCHMKTDKSR